MALANSEKDIFKLHAGLFKPKEGELKIRLQHEPLVDFEIVPYKGISEGRQSRISVLEYLVEGKKRRVVWKRMGAGKNLTKEEAQVFHQRINPYRQELKQAGWNLPLIYYTDSVNNGNEYQIFSYEELIPGGDGEFMVANPEEPNFRKYFLMRAVLETLAGYSEKSLRRQTIADREVTLMPHGLDLKLANVVLNEAGRLFFVDLFGPKELDQNGRWLTYSRKLDSLPEENLLAVCAAREGAILRFYRLAEKLWTQTRGIDLQKLRSDFIKMLVSTKLPKEETTFIANEISTGFPWLDRVYSENQV